MTGSEVVVLEVVTLVVGDISRGSLRKPTSILGLLLFDSSW
jgi:hypothetical protein